LDILEAKQPVADGVGAETLERNFKADRRQIQTLKVGQRVCWQDSATDLGTVAETSWSEVTISWDDGEASSVSHNDMARVERVPTKLI
jgi:hypothetical protein